LLRSSAAASSAGASRARDRLHRITHPAKELWHGQHSKAKRKRGKDPEEKGVQKGEEIMALIYTTCTTRLSYRL